MLSWKGRSLKSAAARAPFVIAVCAGLLVTARPAAAAGPQMRARLVVPPRLAAGAKGTIAVEMTLGPGWHVNSHTPLLKFLVPTTLTLRASTGALSDVRYPKQVERRFDFVDVPLAVYEGTVRFESELTVPESASGTIAVKGILAFQACDDRQCSRPATADLEATVTIDGARSGER